MRDQTKFERFSWLTAKTFVAYFILMILLIAPIDRHYACEMPVNELTEQCEVEEVKFELFDRNLHDLVNNEVVEVFITFHFQMNYLTRYHGEIIIPPPKTEYRTALLLEVLT